MKKSKQAIAGVRHFRQLFIFSEVFGNVKLSDTYR